MNSVKKKILLLTADAGHGHRSAAEAIQAAVLEKYGDDSVVNIINPLDAPDSPEIVQQLEENYDQMVIENPSLYRFSYNAIDAPLVSDIVRAISARVLNDVMLKCVRENEPDIVVTTYPFYSEAAAEAIQVSQRDIPLVIVITDLTDVVSLWYSPSATMHFVPTEQIRDQAIENNIPATRIRVTGLPVHPDVAREQRSKAALRDALGWQKELPTALIVASTRTQQMTLISKYLDRAKLDLQLAVVCGRDRDLYDRLDQVDWKKPVHLYGWVDNMPQMLKASDFVIAKAGGLIVSETLACGLPIIIPEALPGQEEGNVRYIIENDAGAWAPGPTEVLATVISWLKGSRFSVMQSNAKRIGKPQAAYDIAGGIWGLIG